MIDGNNSLFKALAAKYIWWVKPEDVLKRPERVVIQVMNIGDFTDTVAVIESIGEERARELLTNAEAGQFSPRSWHYWHYRLGLAEVGNVAPLPKRRVI
ncbi:MAG TPA: hypothetical protein HPP97_11910 [Desulfuromonadales bacterium]|nr:hypothetical protein [Desulfuromonadales bacterium]